MKALQCRRARMEKYFVRNVAAPLALTTLLVMGPSRVQNPPEVEDDCGDLSRADCLICCDGDEECEGRCPDARVLAALREVIGGDEIEYAIANEGASEFIAELFVARQSEAVETYVQSLSAALRADWLNEGARAQHLDPYVILCLVDLVTTEGKAKVVEDAVIEMLLGDGIGKLSPVGRVGVRGLSLALGISINDEFADADPAMERASQLIADVVLQELLNLSGKRSEDR